MVFAVTFSVPVTPVSAIIIVCDEGKLRCAERVLVVGKLGVRYDRESAGCNAMRVCFCWNCDLIVSFVMCLMGGGDEGTFGQALRTKFSLEALSKSLVAASRIPASGYGFR